MVLTPAAGQTPRRAGRGVVAGSGRGATRGQPRRGGRRGVCGACPECARHPSRRSLSRRQARCQRPLDVALGTPPLRRRCGSTADRVRRLA